LNQAKTELVIDPETSDELKVKKLIFITPYCLKQRVIDVHKQAFIESNLNGVKIIDGYFLIRFGLPIVC